MTKGLLPRKPQSHSIPTHPKESSRLTTTNPRPRAVVDIWKMTGVLTVKQEVVKQDGLIAASIVLKVLLMRKPPPGLG